MTENYPIKYLFEKSSLVGKLIKWQVLLSEFDIINSFQKSVKGQAIADMLVENLQNIASSEERLDDHILTLVDDKWTMYFDGVTNLFD